MNTTAAAAPAAGEKKEYWRWQESVWVDETKNWRDAKFITAGIDVGSVSSQAVVMCDGELYGYSSMRTGSNSPDSANNAIKSVLEKAGGMTLDDLQFVVGTGYGRVNVPFANKAITEIACRARRELHGRLKHPHDSRHGLAGLQSHPLRRARQGH